MAPEPSSAQHALASQPFSVLVGSRIVAFGDGSTTLELALRQEHRQEHGFADGGVLSYLVDNAITFAAATVLGPDLVTAGISVEYLGPAIGGVVRAEARVLGHSSHVAVMRCDVTAHHGGDPVRLCATGQGRALVRSSGLRGKDTE